MALNLYLNPNPIQQPRNVFQIPDDKFSLSCPIPSPSLSPRSTVARPSSASSPPPAPPSKWVGWMRAAVEVAVGIKVGRGERRRGDDNDGRRWVLDIILKKVDSPKMWKRGLAELIDNGEHAFSLVNDSDRSSSGRRYRLQEGSYGRSSFVRGAA